MAAQRYHVHGSGAAADYAAHLLEGAGDCVERRPGPSDAPPDLAWARSGAMALSGPARGAPRLAPGPLASCADGAVRALAALAWDPMRAVTLAELDGGALLGERAALLSLVRRGDVAPGGSCRLLPAADGWIALNLARGDDARLLPAWLECEPAGGTPWSLAARGVSRRTTAVLVERARWLGLPVAAAGPPPRSTPAWVRRRALGPARVVQDRPPRVLDLSALWAGPLCAHLLGLAGAEVDKAESVARPDGARRGPRSFHALLNAGKRSVAFDHRSPEGVAALRRLIRSADIVVESSRARALAQLGIDAGAEVAARPGMIWVSITGYGRAHDGVAFGDDAGVAAGLSSPDAETADAGSPTFVGDAIADPLTGLHAAVAALAAWRRGGGELLDLALCDVVAHAAAFSTPSQRAGRAEVRRRGGEWWVCCDGARQRVEAPRARATRAEARPLGADTRAVLARC